MPGFDGTGPRGMGPMTGGGRGFCNPYSPLGGGYARPSYWARPAVPTFGPTYPQAPGVYGFARGVWPQMGGMAPYGMGMGFGRGFGMGRGRGMRGRGAGRGWGW